jgi:ribonucleotide reductase beta subunit family protein with ferritin-like domain
MNNPSELNSKQNRSTNHSNVDKIWQQYKKVQDDYWNAQNKSLSKDEQCIKAILDLFRNADSIVSVDPNPIKMIPVSTPTQLSAVDIQLMMEQVHHNMYEQLCKSKSQQLDGEGDERKD